MIGGLFGEDKEGRPIYWEAYGTVDCKGIIYSSTKEDVVRYKMRICEAIYQRFEEQTKKVCSNAGGLQANCGYLYCLKFWIDLGLSEYLF